MNITKNIRIGFSVFGFIIVLFQSLPNIIWALFPPKINPLEGNASSILFVEYGEHILGVAIVTLLLFLVNTAQKKAIPNVPLTYVGFAAILLYWLCWALYFCTIQPYPLIYAMVILPPVAFFCAGAAQKIYIISVASVLFLALHLTVALENFPVW